MFTSRKPTQSGDDSSAIARLSVGDLLTSGVIFQWFEAAAVMQGLCAAIDKAGGPVTKTALDLDHVFVDSEGVVTIDGRPDPQSAVPQLKKLLLEMLPPTETAHAKELPESSLADFSRALEYHERPDRELVIQEVRGRWRPGAAPAPRPKQASPSNAGAGRPDESESANNSSHKRGPHMAVVAVLAVLTVAALIYTLWAPEVEAKIGVYTKVISAAKNAAVDPAPAPAPAPAPVPAPSAPAKAAAKPAPIHTDAAASAPARPARTETPAPLPPAPAASVAPPVVRGPVASVVTHPAPAVVTQPRPAFNSAPALMAWPDEENAVVFDAAQTDVVPPTVLNPDMMKQLVPEDGPKTGGSIELVINERGTIDDVKGRPPPRTLAQSMQMMADLSVAKNWKFRPALKDGRPVKYRLVVFR